MKLAAAKQKSLASRGESLSHVHPYSLCPITSFEQGILPRNCLKCLAGKCKFGPYAIGLGKRVIALEGSTQAGSNQL